MSVADRNRIEAEGRGHLLSFEGDDRLQIPSGTDEERVRAIRRYWAAWPEHRDAVLEQYAEAQRRAAEFRKRYHGKPPVTARKNMRRDDPSAWAALAAREYFEIGGGPLGVEMTDFDGNLGPVFHADIKRIANATDDDLQNIPPLRLVYGYQGTSGDGQSELFVLVAGDSQGVPISALADTFPTVDQLLTAIQSTRLDLIRSAYSSFARAYWTRRLEFPIAPESPRITTSPGLDRQRLAKQTFHPIARVEQAFAANAWEPTNDGRGLVHRAVTEQRKKDLIEVLLSPLENPEWFPPVTVDDLRGKLDRIGASGAFVFAVTMSLAIGNEAIDLELDDFVKMLGLEPRSSAQRAEFRATLWECLQLFSQTQVIGEIKGNFHDKKTGARIDRLEQSPMIALTGRQYPREMRFDRSETPIAVSFVAGNFFRRHRENRQMLSDLGDLRALAPIPRGQAAGAWACNIGLALYQIWRERAHHAEIANVGEDQYQTARLGLVTRRQLFNRVLPDPNPFTVLDGNNPARARQYWDDAVEMLRKNGIVSKSGSTKGEYSRKGWANKWLDEELDLRPHRENFIATQQVAEIANGARDFKRKTGRPRKKTSAP